MTPQRLHATCVAIKGRAVLLEGPSGAGKSDLALRLIDRGAVLVSDDCTIVIRHDCVLMASAPATIMGNIEVRGIGILHIESVGDMPIALIVRLDEKVERMPSTNLHRNIAGVTIPSVAIAAFEASAPIKVELALKQVIG